LNAAIRDFGELAVNACQAKLLQWFKEKKDLYAVKWEEPSEQQKSKAVKLQMFLKEIIDDGAILKIKARLVANGRMQDLSVYTA